MSFSKNLEFKKTSFLSKSNSLFIEEMYLKFIKNDPTLAQNWKDYFGSLDEDLKSVVKEIEGPSWQPNKKKINIAGKMRLNEWKGKRNIEFLIEDISLN